MEEFIGFSHGEPVVFHRDKVSWMELSLNNTYYDYTKKLSDKLKIVHQNNFNFRNSIEIENFKTDIFNKFHKQKLKSTNINLKKKVMLIGNAYRNTGMSSVTAPYGIVQLQIELEIISKLQELKYSVLYKKHPGGYYANKKLPFNNDVEIIEGPFESVFHIADILFFYYTRTTTFGYALSSNKPIVVINSFSEKNRGRVERITAKSMFFFNG